jgi:hypothetical protein
MTKYLILIFGLNTLKVYRIPMYKHRLKKRLMHWGIEFEI